ARSLPPQGSPAEKGQPSPDLGFSASSLRPPFSRASEPYPDARIPADPRASVVPRRNPLFLRRLRWDKCLLDLRLRFKRVANRAKFTWHHRQAVREATTPNVAARAKQCHHC